jgi:hypothetical protein
MRRGINARLVAIAKNESAYLIEWISHHLATGFSSIHIYNNDSTDCSLELLGAVKSCLPAGSFEFRDFPRSDPMNQRDVPQLNAYRHAISRARKEPFTHVMFLDLDELLVLNDRSIRDALAAHPEADSLSYQWMMYYGSPGGYEDKPMAERFPFAAINHPKNVELKSIARVGMIRNVGAHICELPPEAKAFLSDGVTPNREGQPGVRRLAEANDIVKNRDGCFAAHFQCKSSEEYCVRRMRGCALTPNGQRNVTHRPLPPPEGNPDLFPPADAPRVPIDQICPSVCERAGAIAKRLKEAVDYERSFAPRIKRYFADEALRYKKEFCDPVG